MRALVYTGPERMQIQDVPEPVVRDGEVLVSISAAGICGSDIHGFLGHSERRLPGLVMGHEAVATILEAHPSVRGWEKSQRVCFNPIVSCRNCPACTDGKPNLCPEWRAFGLDRVQGTFAERLAVPACQLVALSPGLSEQEAILAEPLAVLLHGFRISIDVLPHSVAIFGAGPIGALALVLARLRGVPRVCVVDVHDDRLQVAKALGADHVVNAARENAGAAVRSWSGGGADYVVEAAGHDATRRASVAAAARGARILFLGLAENDTGLPWIEMTRNEQAVFTSFAYTPQDFRASVQMIEDRRFDLRPWTEERPLAEGEQSFARMARNPGSTLKMMLRV